MGLRLIWIRKAPGLSTGVSGHLYIYSVSHMSCTPELLSEHGKADLSDSKQGREEIRTRGGRRGERAGAEEGTTPTPLVRIS